MSKPHIKIYSLGGTIAMKSEGGGAVPVLNAEDLVASVPGLQNIANITFEDFSRTASANLTPESILALAREMGKEAENTHFIITQGTDTMEETAFLLDLLRSRKAGPVVITGAMRTAGAPDHDGPHNLILAAEAVIHPALQNAGVMVAIQGEVHAAETVLKGHTNKLSAFHSPEGGPLAYLSDSGLRVLRQAPEQRYFLALKNAKAFPRVALHWMVLGNKPEDLLRTAEGAEGLVIAAYGGGHVPEIVVDAIESLAKTIPVVFSSRAGAGAVLTDTYGYKGAEIDLIKRGAIPGGSLHPLKARILLMAMLAGDENWPSIQKAFVA